MAAQVLDILLCTGGLPFDGNTLKTKSLGGSESAALYMARALAKRGHRVRHFTNGNSNALIDGVQYLPLEQWPQYVVDAHHDVSIVQRNPQAMSHPLNCKLSILWQHDLALKRAADVARATKWRTDKTFLLSQYHAEQHTSVIGYEPHEMYITRNGVDFSAIPAPRPHDERSTHKFLYAARPERGLENVLSTVFPAILKRLPNAELLVCSYDNQIPELGGLYQKLEALAAGLPVRQLGALTKAQLYQVMQDCGAYLYPTPGPFIPNFAEISCIAAIEAQANGLPFIHTGVGALSETVAPHDLTNVTIDRMADAAVDLVTSPGLWSAVQRRQLDHVQQYNWDTIAAEWETSFHTWIAENNNSLPRLAQWFYRRSEIEGVRECIKRADAAGEQSPILERLRHDCEKHYWFTDTNEKLAAHYHTMGRDIVADLNTRKDSFTLDMITQNQEPRFNIMAQVLKEAGVKRLFDAGCGHGWSSLFFANNLNVEVVGFDVDPGAVRFAQEMRERVCPATHVYFQSRWDGAQEMANKLFKGEKADAAICSEVLEHVVDPNAFLDRVETFVKPGGLVVCTVPFGPWEFDGPNWHGLGRTHIREISQHCIYEMFGHKAEFKCGAVRTAHHATLGDPMGFYLFSFRADGQPSRPRNIERMMRLQRPTETLAINIIAGPGSEKTIRWTLDSVKSIADEIIVGDTGMSDAALIACNDYNATVVNAPKPLVDAFSASRNAVLDCTSADWVLWIDTDERLIQPETVRQYLRKNQANGYALRQVHAAVDDQIGTDTPVRLFRRDSGCRFIGLIHEHPEIGLNKGPGNVCIVGGYPAIWHMGYETNQVRGHRFIRNRPLVERDRAENPDRVLGIFLDARDHVLMMQEFIARAGGKASEQSQSAARRVVELADQFNAAGVPLMGISCDQFRTDALRHLGLGFDATVDIRLNRDGVGDAGPHALRFLSEDEMRAFIDKRLGDKVERIKSEHW